MPRITISEPGKTPQPYRLKTDRKITKIGRGSDNDIILETGSASTNHCEMLRVEGGFTLQDNNSTNGILLDETRFQVIDLIDGITVSIGDDIELNFELSEEEIKLLEEEDFQPQQRAAFPKSKEQPKQQKQAVNLTDEDDEYEEVVVRHKKKGITLDDLDDDEDIRPKKKSAPKPTPRARAKAKPAPVKSSSGIGSTLVFAILAAVFLLGGMVIRHYQDHGTFLFDKKAQE